jgi:hypothetical protein
VRLAIGQGQRAQPPRLAGGQDLGHRPTRVVGNQVDFGQPSSVTEAGEEPGQRAEREVLTGGCWGAPVQRQVDRDAPALARHLRDHMAPQVAAGPNAMDEQGGGPSPPVSI